MGCEVVVGGADEAELRAVTELFARREQTFSRFRPSSELNHVNASNADAVEVSRDFAAAVSAALAAAAQTHGLVDPTLHDALVNAGYDQDFAGLAPDPRPLGPAVPARPRDFRLAGRLLLRPPGLRLDLEGVVKSMAVDDALELVDGPGFVSAGGDLAARGPLEVALPGGGSVRLVRGGLATSGSSRRRWMRGGARQHHLVDPVAGRPAVSRWRQVTVCGASCLAADVAAKAAFLLGEDGPDWLDARGMPGRFVEEGGAVRVNGGWRAGAGGPAACT